MGNLGIGWGSEPRANLFCTGRFTVFFFWKRVPCIYSRTGFNLRPRIRAGRAGHWAETLATLLLRILRSPCLVTRWVTRNLVSPSAYCIYCTTSEPSWVTRLPLLGVSEDSRRSNNCTISWVADLIRFDGADTNALYSADPAGRKVE